MTAPRRNLTAELRETGAWCAAPPGARWSRCTKATTSRSRRRSRYYALLSLFPFLLIVISILGSVAAHRREPPGGAAFVLRYFPRQFDFITAQLDAFRQTPIRLGVGGGLALVWASLGVFDAISTAVNYAWGVEKKRNFWKHRLFSFLMLCVAGPAADGGAAAGHGRAGGGARWFANFHWSSRAHGAARRHGPLCHASAAGARLRPDLLLRAERDRGAGEGRLAWRAGHRPAVGRGPQGLFAGSSAT